MALCRVSEARRMMHCLWAGVSFQQLINGEQAIVTCHLTAGACQAQIGWVQGKRKGAPFLDGVELSHQDISFWHSAYFVSLHTSKKWGLSTAAAVAALGIHCHFPTLHINISKQTTLLHNRKLQMEYDLNMKYSCKYFRGRTRFEVILKLDFPLKAKTNIRFLFAGFPHFYSHVLVMQLPSYSQQPSSDVFSPVLCPNRVVLGSIRFHLFAKF